MMTHIIYFVFQFPETTACYSIICDQTTRHDTNQVPSTSMCLFVADLVIFELTFSSWCTWKDGLTFNSLRPPDLSPTVIFLSLWWRFWSFLKIEKIVLRRFSRIILEENVWESAYFSKCCLVIDSLKFPRKHRSCQK